MRTVPCYIVFENDSPEIAYFEEYAAKNEVIRRQEEKGIKDGKLPDGNFYYIHIHEIQIVDRRKERSEQ